MSKRAEQEVGFVDEPTNFNPYLTTAEDFAKAGLFDEGVYNWQVKSMKPATITNSKTGEEVPVIAGRLVAKQRAVYNSDGEFQSVEDLVGQRGKFQNFSISGKGLSMLKSLYTAVTGRLPTGTMNKSTGRFELDVLALAEELIGGSAWNSLYHSEPNEESGAVYDNISFNFKNKPHARYVRKKRLAQTEEIPF